MKQRLSAIHLTLLALFLAALCWACGQEAPEEPAAKEALSPEELGKYSHGIVVKDLRFLWTLREDSIDIKLAAPTIGWVGIGFNPDVPENMGGASFIIGYVKGGKVEAFDHYGIAENKHQDDEAIDGRSDLSNVSGSEQDGRTVLEFTIPLSSGDSTDKPVSRDGDNTVLLAYGRSDSVVLKHRFRAILTVNLSTGEHSVLKMK
jgi:hypothetical protein